MSSSWLRLWVDMPNDPKWRTIAKVSGQEISPVIAVYLHVLVNASNANERGRTQSLCSEDIASALDLSTDQVELILKAMQGRVLDGDVVSGWSKRQPEREDGSAGRAKAWREAKKAEKQTNQTPTNAAERTRTKPNAPDSDSDSDSEGGERSPVDNSPPPISPEFMEVMKSRPELDPDVVYVNFNAHYPAPQSPQQRLARWKKWVSTEHSPSAVSAQSITVPSRPGIDPAVAKCIQDSLVCKAPPAEIRARLRQLSGVRA